MKKFEPFDKSDSRCQCVMDHLTLEEGGQAQCTGTRRKGSNLFCQGCEETHGDWWRTNHPESA